MKSLNQIIGLLLIYSISTAVLAQTGSSYDMNQDLDEFLKNSRDGATEMVPYQFRTGKLATDFPNWYGDWAGPTFLEGSILLESDVSLGCDGKIHSNLFGNLEADFKRMADYIQDNALGFGVNYLAYKIPGFYDLLQNMNQKIDRFYDMQLFTCSNIRQLALKDRTNSASIAKNESDCMSDNKGDALKCVQSDNAKKDMTELKELIKSSSERLEERHSKMQPIEGGMPSKQITEKNVSHAVVLDHVSIDDKALVDYMYKVMDAFEVTSKDGNDSITTVSKPSSVEELAETRSKEYSIHLRTLLAAHADGSKKVSEADRAKAEDAFDKLRLDKALLDITPGLLDALYVLKRKSPLRYAIAENQLTREMALAHIEYNRSQTERIIADSISRGHLSQDKYAELRQKYEKAQGALNLEVAAVHARNSVLGPQLELRKSIIEEVQDQM
jgi:hypothetical protein